MDELTPKTIYEFPSASKLDGTELLPIAQGGRTKKLSVSEIAPIKTFFDVSQLGLTVGGATVTDAWDALPSNGVLLSDASGFSSSEVPDTTGTVEISKIANGWIFFHGADDYRQAITGGTPSGTWDQVATTARVNAADPGGTWGAEAEKFGDGFMICTGFLRFQGKSGLQSLSISFAETFINEPLGVSASVNGGAAGDTSPTVGTVIPSTTGINVYANTNTSSANYVLRYIAIGRWR